MLRNGRGPLFPRTYVSCLGAPHKDSRRLQPGRLKREPIACVASGISRASAFVLVAKRWRRVAKPWEDWWRVQASPLANSLAGEDSRAKPAREWQLYHRSRAHESRQLRRLGSPVYWRLGYCDSQNLTQVSHWPLFTGCSCFLPLGMESGHLHDSALSASTSYDGNHSPQKSRLNTASSNGRVGAWCALRNDANQWLQVHFGRETTVSKVATQGGYDSNHWVMSYSLSHSVDGSHWAWYRLSDGQIKVTF